MPCHVLSIAGGLLVLLAIAETLPGQEKDLPRFNVDFLPKAVAVVEPVEPASSTSNLVLAQSGTGSAAPAQGSGNAAPAQGAGNAAPAGPASSAGAAPAAPGITAATPPASTAPPSWRSRYELGPGDVLNFGLHGKPTLKRLNVPVAPDGTISYLEARQVDVRRKTIEEVRAEMNKILSPYHRDPNVIITPARLGSKRYTLLGEVRQNGTFPLERPTSLLQAIAISGGINLGVSGEDAIELADLRRSFVVRHGDRLNIDMESLYLRGDLSQNVQLEPGDYVYVASKIRHEIYVFGAVALPGVKSIESRMSSLGAVASAGGFTPSAWRDRVLVIRGRLDQPQVFVVEANKVLHGKAQDFQLEPGDIVYVHNRPWTFAEHLLDVAIKGFIDGAVAGALAEDNVAVSANGISF